MNLKNIKNKTTELLVESFIKSFQNTLATFTPDEKQELIKLSPIILNKWYFSALFEDSILSPANILNSLQHSTGENVPCLKLIFENDDNIKVNWYANSIDHHCFVEDLKCLCNYCDPAGVFENEFIAPSAIADDIISSDTYYFNYLFVIAKRIGIIKPIPSINTLKYQLNNTVYSTFFNRENYEVLKQLTDMAICLFVEVFTEKMELPCLTLTNEIVREFFNTGATTDDLYKKVYEKLGFNFEEMLDAIDNPDLTLEDELLMSSAYFVGTIFDKWLFTPLGTYLNLITPLYSVPYDFMSEADLIRPVLLTGCDISNEVFSHCNYFCLTPIGEKIFGFKNENSAFEDLSNSFSTAQVEALISSYLKINNVNTNTKTYKAKPVYSLKIQLFYDEHKWKVIEIDKHCTLHQLYKQILLFWGIEKSPKYTFSLFNKTEKIKTRINNPNHFALTCVNWEKNTLFFSDRFNKFVDMEITLLEISNSVLGASYPRLLKQSREITMEERDDY